MNQQEQDDDGELLDEQMMLKALLSEAEDTASTQTAYQEQPKINATQSTTELNHPSHSSAFSEKALKNSSSDRSASASDKILPEKKIPRTSMEVKRNPPSPLIAQSIEETKANAMARLNSMNVKLSFLLGECFVTYNEFKNLKPGQLIHLSKTFASPISIYSHNNLLGTAEIIDIEGAVGIRIQSLANK